MIVLFEVVTPDYSCYSLFEIENETQKEKIYQDFIDGIKQALKNNIKLDPEEVYFCLDYLLPDIEELMIQKGWKKPKHVTFVTGGGFDLDIKEFIPMTDNEKFNKQMNKLFKKVMKECKVKRNM